jgi:hypothetical protein
VIPISAKRVGYFTFVKHHWRRFAREERGSEHTATAVDFWYRTIYIFGCDADSTRRSRL